MGLLGHSHPWETSTGVRGVKILFPRHSHEAPLIWSCPGSLLPGCSQGPILHVPGYSTREIWEPPFLGFRALSILTGNSSLSSIALYYPIKLAPAMTLFLGRLQKHKEVSLDSFSPNLPPPHLCCIKLYSQFP